MVTGQGNHGYHTPDRRPWLILSRAEAFALQQAVLAQLRSPRARQRLLSANLSRALRVIDRQIRFIDGSADGLEPNITEALLREEGRWDA